MAAEHSCSHRQEENWGRCPKSEENNSFTSEDGDVLTELLEALDEKGHEMMKKLVARVENDVPFEQVFRETWHHFRGKHASQMLEKIERKMGVERDGGLVRGERGVDDGSLQDALKNERFKVKTVNVIEEEGKK